jgi:hypothetical protein
LEIIMKLKQALILTAIAAALCSGANRLAAQNQPPGRGNFDPEQARQRMMERYKTQLDVKSDDEWKVIQERIEKVTQARREVGFGGGMGGMGFGRPGRPGGNAGNAEASADGQGPRRGGRGGFGPPEPSPEAEALQKAIEAKAPADEIKAKLAKLREVRKEKEAKLETAQEELRKVLSVRQEAAAVLAGLVK